MVIHTTYGIELTNLLSEYIDLICTNIFYMFAFNVHTNVISRCLSEDPTSRIRAQDALNHSFFKDHDLMPTTKDMVLLPSHILQLYNVFKDEKYKDPKEVEGKLFSRTFLLSKF